MWEYAIVFENNQGWVCNGDPFPNPIYEVRDALNAAGQERWELVAINKDGQYVLKRRKDFHPF